MRRRSIIATWVLAVLPMTLASSPKELRAGPTCTPSLMYTESASVAPKFVDYPSPQLVQIPQFDPAQGTLCFAVVRITASYDTLIKVENNTNASPFITVSATETVAVQPPAFMAPVLPAVSHAESIPPTTQSVGPWDNGPYFSFTGPDTATFSFTPTNPRTATLANVAFSSLDGGFANFTGVGNIPGGFSIDGMGTYTVYSNAGSSNSQVLMQVGATVEIEYHYVPEPATVLPLLGAMFILRWSRRRR